MPPMIATAGMMIAAAGADAMIAAVHSWRKEMRSGEEEQKEPRQKRGQTDAKAKAKAEAKAKAIAK